MPVNRLMLFPDFYWSDQSDAKTHRTPKAPSCEMKAARLLYFAPAFGVRTRPRVAFALVRRDSRSGRSGYSHHSLITMAIMAALGEDVELGAAWVSL
jgi:hypothetical protein